MRPAQATSPKPPRAALVLALHTALSALMIPGCGFSAITDASANRSGTSDDVGPQNLPQRIITVRIANNTDAAVLANVYVTTNALSNTTETLFVDKNQFTDRIGLASTGLLPPGDADVLEVDCDEAIVIGTSGGVFLDPDTGERLGTGTPRILQQGLVFDCGALVTMVYGQEEARFNVDVTLR